MFNERLGSLYPPPPPPPELEIEVLDELGDDDLGAARFIYRATLRRAEAPRGLEYVIFARGRDGLLTEVFESLDTLGPANLFAGQPVDKNPDRSLIRSQGVRPRVATWTWEIVWSGCPDLNWGPLRPRTKRSAKLSYTPGADAGASSEAA